MTQIESTLGAILVGSFFATAYEKRPYSGTGLTGLAVQTNGDDHRADVSLFPFIPK